MENQSSITRLRIRKDQVDLSPGERKAFVNAVLTLKQIPSQLYPPSQNRYDDYVLIHSKSMLMTVTGAMPAHQGPAFLPWHREFIRRFEMDLQSIDQRVNLPYWDWTKDNEPSSSIWDSDFMGGNGRDEDGRVMTGPFAYDSGKWTLNINDFDDPNPGPDLRRHFGKFPSVPTLPSAAQVTDALNVIPYDSNPWITNTTTGQPQPSFRNRLEGWYGDGNIHNRVHLWVSGGTPPNFDDAGSMFWSTSLNDPVFFLHHCNIDRLWAEWQRQHPQQGYVPNIGGPQGHNINDPMEPWKGATTPASVIDHHSLGYIYDKEQDKMQMMAAEKKKITGPFVWKDLIQ
jgi:tyrosinase